jgi:hypothetical protein
MVSSWADIHAKLSGVCSLWHATSVQMFNAGKGWWFKVPNFCGADSGWCRCVFGEHRLGTEDVLYMVVVWCTHIFAAVSLTI